jgi:hypothetical protein
MNCRTRLLLYALVGAMACGTTPAFAILIDDFSQGDVTLTDSTAIGSVSDLKTGLDPLHTAAGARHITFNVYDMAPFGDMGNVTVSVSSGSLRHQPQPGLTAANFFVNYGVTSLGLPPMSLNLAADGAHSLALDFLSAMPDASLSANTNFGYDLIIKSGNGTSILASRTFPVSASSFTVRHPFAAMTNVQPIGSTFDFSNVTEIRFGTSNGTFYGPFSLTSIRTVPEPASLVVWLVLPALAVRRRKSPADIG